MAASYTIEDFLEVKSAGDASFSPDGTKMMWTSNRTENGTSQLFIADWLRK